MERLTGVTWAYNAISQDYCLSECVASLKEFCKEVIVLDAGSTDGTDELIKSFQDKKTRIILCDNEEWQSQQGKWKLSYFTNKMLDKLNTSYFYYQQADEIIHEASYPWIEKAIHADADGYLISRINLWGDPFHQLNVEHSRKPCSTHIVRLAKAGALAYDDAESLDVLATDAFVEQIRMYHMGFVRRRDIHPQKIRHMQSQVFQVGVDPKLDGMAEFDGRAWFDYEKDLIPIQEPLPALIQQWAKERE